MLSTCRRYCRLINSVCIPLPQSVPPDNVASARESFRYGLFCSELKAPVLKPAPPAFTAAARWHVPLPDKLQARVAAAGSACSQPMKR